MRQTTLLVLGLLFALPSFADSRDTVRLDEVVVEGIQQVERKEFVVSVVERARLRETHRTSILPTLSEQVPGLFVTQRGMLGYGVSGGGSGAISLRGISSATGQLLILIDGHPQYNGIFGHGIGDAYNTMGAERVEVVRGPASVLYGSNAMGGVINIITKKPQSDGVRTHIQVAGGSYGTAKVEAMNNVKKGRFSSALAVQYQRSDNHRPRMGFEQYGGVARITYKVGKSWDAFVHADVTHFEAHHPGAESSPIFDAVQGITRGIATVGVDNNYGRLSGRMSAYTNWGKHTINDGHGEFSAPQERLFQSKDMLAGLRVYEDFKAWKGGSIRAGFDYQHIYGDAYYIAVNGGNRLEVGAKQSAKSHRNTLAGYAHLRQEFDWISLSGGVRYDYHSVCGGEVVPEASVAVKPMDAMEVKLNVGKGFRNPTMRELYLYGPSNESLQAERMWNYELSYNHKLGAVSYGFSIYYIAADNVIQTVNFKNVNSGTIRNCGIELEAEYRVNSHWRLSTNHTYLKMKYPVVAVPRYKGYLGISAEYGGFSGVVGFQQINGLYSSVAAGNEKIQDYSLLNISAGYKVLRWLRLYVSGENLLGSRYEINAGYPMPRANVMGGVEFAF